MKTDFRVVMNEALLYVKMESMINRLGLLALLLLPFLLLTACNSNPIPPVINDDIITSVDSIADSEISAPVLTSQSSDIVLPNVTVAASLTPTPEVVVADSPTLPPYPTQTPTLMPTLVSTPDATFYDMPEWISSPAESLLLKFEVTTDSREQDYAIAIYDVTTRERFEIPINDCCTTHSWVVKDDTLYIKLDHPRRETGGQVLQEPYRELIDTHTGELRQVPIQFPNRREILSPNSRYVAVIDQTPMNMSATVFDREQNRETALRDLFDGRYSSYSGVAWTANSAFIAVLQAAFSPDLVVASQYGLAIYTAGGEPYRMYAGVNSNQWAPNLPYRILYTIGHFSETTPCILNVIDNNRTCLEAVANWREERDVAVAQFEWSPAGDKISFIYWDYATTDSGLCYLRIDNEEISCPVSREDLLILEDYSHYVVGHHWSPQEDYIAVFVNPNGPASHDASFTSIGIVSVADGSLEILGRAIKAFQTDRLWWSSLDLDN